MSRILIFLLALLPVVLDSALKGSVLLLLVAVAVTSIRNVSAAARHLVWMIGIIGLLLLPLFSAVLPGWRVLPSWARLPIATQLSERRSPSPRVSRARSGVGSESVASMEDAQPVGEVADHSHPTRAGTRESTLHKAFSVRDSGLWLSGVWISVAAFLIVRLIASILLLRMRTRLATAISDGPLQHALQAACAQLCLSQRIRLFVDDRRIVPLVWGVLRPRLILPSEAYEWEPQRLRAVLLHELAHVKRRDVLVMLAMQIACAVHWFNPLAWLTAWRLHVERERACDDLVLTSGVMPSDYAEHLLHVATRLETASPAGALAMARPSRLEGRLVAVLNQQLKRGSVKGSVVLLATTIGLSIIIPVAMLSAQDKPAISQGEGAVGSSGFIERSIAPQPPVPGEATVNPIVPAAGKGTLQPPESAKTVSTEQKVPILGDIPVLGRLFTKNGTSSDEATPERPESQHVIEVRADGTLAFDATVLRYEALAEKLTASVAGHPKATVTVRAERKAPYTAVVKVLEACRSVGLANVTIAAAGDEDQQAAEVPRTEQPGESAPNPTGELAPTRLEDARRELERINALHRQKLVSAADLDRAKAEVEIRKAELAGDAAAVMQTRLQLAERELERLVALNQQKFISQQELDPAKAEVEIREAELAGDSQAAMQTRLKQAVRDFERLTELNKEKMVSQQELEHAKFEVDLRRAELAGDPVQVKRTRLQQAQQDLKRFTPLYEQKLVSQQEIDEAKANVDLRRAELAGDTTLAAQVGLKRAEAELDRASKLRADKLIGEAEYDALRSKVEAARAQLQMAASETESKASANQASSTEILRQLDETIKLASEKLAMLKLQQAEAGAERGEADPPAPATDEKVVTTRWQPFTPERVDEALKAGRPVFIQFTADWSLDAKANERRVLNTAAVSSAFASRNVLALKADWTDGNTVVTEWLRKFAKPGVPLYILYMPGKAEPHVFPGVLTADDIVRELSPIGK